MLIKKRKGYEIPSSQITPEHIYRSRRQFMKGAAALGTTAVLAACGSDGAATNPGLIAPNVDTEGGKADAIAEGSALGESRTAALQRQVETINAPGTISAEFDELGNPVNRFRDITNHNNYYEFTTDKARVAELAVNFPTTPWKVEVGGLVDNPGVYDIDHFRTAYEQEERIYRLRCVEAWSMVIPWVGFPMSKFIEEVAPQSNAKYIRFETIYDPPNMEGQQSPWFNFPYVEGLRIDEAMNDLTILATGMYGAHLLPQNGAPLRLVIPWKYGFKWIKSIVKIDFVEEMPVSLWMAAAPNEYGFYANVNPNVDHPRWSQAIERRIGEFGRVETMMFNGYEEQVAELYTGMDLVKNF